MLCLVASVACMCLWVCVSGCENLCLLFISNHLLVHIRSRIGSPRVLHFLQSRGIAELQTRKSYFYYEKWDWRPEFRKQDIGSYLDFLRKQRTWFVLIWELFSPPEPKASCSAFLPWYPKKCLWSNKVFSGGFHYWKDSLGKTLKYKLPHKLFSSAPVGACLLGPKLCTNRPNQLSFIRNQRFLKENV
jgi:hypothetical protein